MPWLSTLVIGTRKYGELNSWCEGQWGYAKCSPERCRAILNTAVWKLNMADNCYQSWGYTRSPTHSVS
eukprot:1124690-Pelagomonas_calceolata.AAC.1